MLYGELVTLLAGRYVTIDMFPLSFQEYMGANSYGKKTARELFADYMRFGSFPYLATITKDESIVENYIDGIF